MYTYYKAEDKVNEIKRHGNFEKDLVEYIYRMENKLESISDESYNHTVVEDELRCDICDLETKVEELEDDNESLKDEVAYLRQQHH